MNVKKQGVYALGVRLNKAARFLLMKAHPTRKYHAARDKQFSCPLRLEAQDTALSRR